MNVVDAVIIKVLSKPYRKYEKWFVNVKVESYGRCSITYVMADTREEVLDKSCVGMKTQV